MRAQSFAYLFLAVVLWLVAEDSRAQRLRPRTWLVVPALVLWANTHGTVLLGAGLVALYAGYRVAWALMRGELAAIPPYLLLGAAALASVACTPYGLGVIRYYRDTVGNPVITQNVAEWMPPSLGNPASWAFFGLIGLTAIALFVGLRRRAWPDPVLFGAAAVLLAVALTAVRDQAWFALAGSLLAADTLAQGSGRVPSLARGFRLAVAAGLGAVALACVAVLAVRSSPQYERPVPVRAMDVAAVIAARHPAMRILADASSGSAMLWLHPAATGRVGYDIRFEQYAAAELTAYFDFLGAEGPRWQRVTRGYDIIVASAVGRPRLVAALAHLPGWRIVYRDPNGLVVERKQVLAIRKSDQTGRRAGNRGLEDARQQRRGAGPVGAVARQGL